MQVTCKINSLDDSVVEALIWQGIPVPQANHTYHVKDIKVFRGILGVALIEIPHKIYTESYPDGMQVYWKLSHFSFEQAALEDFLITQ